MPNGATATMAQMSAASDAFSTWLRQSREVLECRRLQYNAVIERLNSVNSAWDAQLDTFCARRNIRCEQRDRAQPETPTP